MQTASNREALRLVTRVCKKCNMEFTGVRCKACEKMAKAVYREKSKALISESDALYRAQNAEKIRDYQKEYRARRDPEDRRNYQQAYYVRNRLRVIAAVAKYRLARPEWRSAINRKWRLANLDLCRTYHHNRAARLQANGGQLSKDLADKLMRHQRGLCINCREKLSVTGYQLDHIVPVALGGANADENIQLLCPPCNSSKWAKDPVTWAQEHGRLI
jgi:5-methylcytosine-specific restriction endonuclease McrA